MLHLYSMYLFSSSDINWTLTLRENCFRKVSSGGLTVRGCKYTVKNPQWKIGPAMFHLYWVTSVWPKGKFMTIIVSQSWAADKNSRVPSNLTNIRTVLLLTKYDCFLTHTCMPCVSFIHCDPAFKQYVWLDCQGYFLC